MAGEVTDVTGVLLISSIEFTRYLGRYSSEVRIPGEVSQSATFGTTGRPRDWEYKAAVVIRTISFSVSWLPLAINFPFQKVS